MIQSVKVVGYLRVSTEGQAESGLGLEAQKQKIREWAKPRGVELVMVGDTATAANLDRPGLIGALEMIASGEASGLVAATLDRLTRSLADFAELMTWFREADAQLAVLDTNLDTTTPTGEAMAAMMATFVQLERRLIGQRTKDALAAKKARGELPGRPAIGPKVRSRIERQRRRGWTYQRIADGLNHDGIPTARGGAEWRPSSVATGLGYRQKPRRHRAELPTLGRRRS